MKVLVVLNMRGTAMGLLGTALADAGVKTQYCAAYCGEKLARTPEGFAGLVIMGGEQNALDDEGSPYFPELLKLIRQFHDDRKPVLGICLGSQLIARAFGGRNRVGGTPEFGWCELALTQEGRADPLMSQLPQAFRQFQWHDDTFTLPDGAIRLASSATVENEAFRISDTCYAIQFHSEAGMAAVRDWSTMFRDILLDKDPAWLARFEEEAASHAEASDTVSKVLLSAWVALLKS